MRFKFLLKETRVGQYDLSSLEQLDVDNAIKQTIVDSIPTRVKEDWYGKPEWMPESFLYGEEDKIEYNLLKNHGVKTLHKIEFSGFFDYKINGKIFSTYYNTLYWQDSKKYILDRLTFLEPNSSRREFLYKNGSLIQINLSLNETKSHLTTTNDFVENINYSFIAKYQQKIGTLIKINITKNEDKFATHIELKFNYLDGTFKIFKDKFRAF